MIAAGFTGGEAEELRRAMGFKRSEKRMQEIEAKLRHGMEQKGITGKTQDEIVHSITAFALYGFPESHAASFALLAYASAYLKCRYLAAFTAALLNNQPMGFYHPATLVKDAQRHGLKIEPIDVTRSEWLCALEKHSETICVRLGMRYVKGLRKEAAEAIVQERAVCPFASMDDLARRVFILRKPELTALAEVGALNWVGTSVDTARERSSQTHHRRDALWQVERAARPTGSLFERLAGSPQGQPCNLVAKAPSQEDPCPLATMTAEERLVADFRGTAMTVGPHPMAYCRAEMKRLGVLQAIELPHVPDGRLVRIAGGVIARQRPGTAKGFVFLSLEDETGIANAIVTPDLFEQNRSTLVNEQFLLVEGKLQNQDNVISVKADRILPLAVTRVETSSHNFH